MLVHEVAAVGAGVGAGDGEPETGARNRVHRVLAAREAFEQARNEIVSDARSAVLDREPQVRFATGRADRDRESAVAESVREQVRHDPVERHGVDPAV